MPKVVFLFFNFYCSLPVQKTSYFFVYCGTSLSDTKRSVPFTQEPLIMTDRRELHAERLPCLQMFIRSTGNEED